MNIQNRDRKFVRLIRSFMVGKLMDCIAIAIGNYERVAATMAEILPTSCRMRHKSHLYIGIFSDCRKLMFVSERTIATLLFSQ